MTSFPELRPLPLDEAIAVLTEVAALIAALPPYAPDDHPDAPRNTASAMVAVGLHPRPHLAARST